MGSVDEEALDSLRDAVGGGELGALREKWE